MAALACFGAMLWIGRLGDALTLPIPLQSGFNTSKEFHVPAKGQYRIELRCSRTIPFERLKGVLQGGNLVSISLTDDGVSVSLHYLQEPRFRPGITSTDEFGNLGFAQDWISQDIAVFAGDPKRVYKIACSVIRPLDELRVTEPTLIVGLDPLEIKGLAVLSFLLLVGALLFGVVSLVTGLIYFRLRRRASRAQPAEV
jgi:hypothetical protein